MWVTLAHKVFEVRWRRLQAALGLVCACPARFREWRWALGWEGRLTQGHYTVKPFQSPALSGLFPSVKTSYPTKRRKHWWEEGACAHAESTQYHACKSPPPPAPRHPLVLCSPWTFLGFLTIFLPCSHNCLFKKMLERKIFTKITTPHPDSHLWSLALVCSACIFTLH